MPAPKADYSLSIIGRAVAPYRVVLHRRGLTEAELDAEIDTLRRDGLVCATAFNRRTVYPASTLQKISITRHPKGLQK